MYFIKIFDALNSYTNHMENVGLVKSKNFVSLNPSDIHSQNLLKNIFWRENFCLSFWLFRDKSLRKTVFLFKLT